VRGLAALADAAYMASYGPRHNLVVFAILTLAGPMMEGIGFVDGLLASVMTALMGVDGPEAMGYALLRAFALRRANRSYGLRKII